MGSYLDLQALLRKRVGEDVMGNNIFKNNSRGDFSQS